MVEKGITIAPSVVVATTILVVTETEIIGLDLVTDTIGMNVTIAADILVKEGLEVATLTMALDPVFLFLVDLVCLESNQ